MPNQLIIELIKVDNDTLHLVLFPHTNNEVTYTIGADGLAVLLERLSQIQEKESGHDLVAIDLFEGAELPPEEGDD